MAKNKRKYKSESEDYNSQEAFDQWIAFQHERYLKYIIKKHSDCIDLAGNASIKKRSVW